MSAPKMEARERILEAAAASFQTLGYARTTTQTIAQKAGVAEVTLFRHFGDKQTLFQAVIQQIGGGLNFDTLAAQLSYDLEQDLTLISRHILRFFLAQQDGIRMLMFEATHFPEMKAALAQNPRDMMALLARYFQEQIDAGRMRLVDVQATSQALVSTAFGYAVGIYPMRDLLPGEVSIERISSEIVRIFLAALQPAGR